MRIISGTYGGRYLIGKIPPNVRPTTDYARETMFDVLSSLIDIENKVFLDLFSGAGAIGLESLSRGAAKVYFVDKSIESINYLQKNIELLQIPAEKYKIIKSDAIQFIMKFKITDNFDVIFADPPYIENYCWRICQIISKNSLLNEEGLLIYESEKNKTELIPDEFKIIKEKKFGNTKLYFIKLNYSK